MAFESIGLGAVLSFDGSKFISGIRKPRDELGRFVAKGNQTISMFHRLKVAGMGALRALGRSARMAGMGISRLRSGMMGATFAFAPLAIGVGLAGKKFADFQQQMQNVKSVSAEMTKSPQKFAAMEQKAKQLGATTQFTATQAGEGFELMSRQGFTFEQQMKGVSGVLALAAADSIELKQAADIAGNTLRAFGMEAEDMTRVADVLAATSANSNTNVLQLGESFKSAAPLSSTMKVSLEDTAAALGLIANAGIKAGRSGTAFKNMLIKLAKPNTKATAYMKEFGLSIYETEDGALDLRKTMRGIIEGTDHITSATKRARIMVEMFGLRAPGAVNALAIAIKKGDFEKLPKILENAEGTAQRMADVRLDSFIGQITLLKSATEGFFIEVAEGIMTMGQGALKTKIIPFIQDVVAVLQELKKPEKVWTKLFLRTKFGMAAEVAFGVHEAIQAIIQALKDGGEKLKEWGVIAKKQFGPDGIRKVVKWITIFVLVAAAIAPIALVIMMVGLAIGAVGSIISGVGMLISGAFLPVLLIGGALILIFTTLQDENESLLDTAARVWGSISTWVSDTWHNAIKPMWEGMKEAAEHVLPILVREFKESWAIIKEALIDVFRVFGVEMDNGETDWKQTGKIIIKVLAVIVLAVVKTLTFIIVMFAGAVKIIKIWGDSIVDNVAFPFIWIIDLVMGVVDGFEMMFSGSMVAGLKHLGTALLNFVLAPFKLILRNAIRLADAVGVGIPDAIRSFANEEAFLEAVDPVAAPKVKRGMAGITKAQKVKGEVIAKQAATTGAEAQAAESKGLLEKVKDGIKELQGSLGEKMDELKDVTKKKPCVDSNVSVAIDGEEVARGQARHKSEISDRAGFTNQSWQRRMVAEHAAAPVRGRS